ncbi:MAG TPA: N-succinylarginine dihydrolase [Desulfomonilaceae bacterium]|nr:N-succinylarginine dihydrolase [Desulfomonilaceae bacterium]
MKDHAFEANFDGLVGPTHNYAGLSYGNIASEKYAMSVSNPRAAVLQGLQKMQFIADLGLVQGVLPPQERPDTRSLRRLGFRGSEREILQAAARESPQLLAAVYSSSSMWAANAATVSPSPDTVDGKIHFTPANLVTQFHRSLEVDLNARVLKTIFRDPRAFVHHAPVPSVPHFSDEGAANHTRLCKRYGNRGLELFVYGRVSFRSEGQRPQIFPARQTLEASAAVARLHLLDPRGTVFAKQHPDAIDAGVFHNDVISLGNENVFFYHADAFEDPSTVERVKRVFSKQCGDELITIRVDSSRVSLTEAVETYLFNSQIVTLGDGSMILIAPEECREHREIRAFLDGVVNNASNPIREVRHVEVRQSMKNGGGPACLRLRVVMTEKQKALTHQAVYLTDGLYEDLTGWANLHYRDRLDPKDLTDPLLPDECRTALDALTQILNMGSIYDFQKEDSEKEAFSPVK